MMSEKNQRIENYFHQSLARVVRCILRHGLLFGCMEERPDSDYVDTNVVEKGVVPG